MAGIAQRLPETDADVEFDEDRVIHTYTLNYQVEADSKDESEDSIKAATNMPIVGLSTYGQYRAVCKNKRIVRVDENRRWWAVAADFDTRRTGTNKNEQDQSDDLTALPATIRWSTEEILIYEDKDLDDKPFVNSAKDPFEGGLALPVVVTVLSVQRYEAAFSETEMKKYANKVNSGDFRGYTVGQAWMAEMSAEITLNGEQEAWSVSYVVKMTDHREEFWKTAKILNRGEYYLTPAPTQVRQRFMTSSDPSNGVPAVPRMGLLTADGLDNTGGDATYESFRVKDEVDFGPLQIG